MVGMVGKCENAKSFVLRVYALVHLAKRWSQRSPGKIACSKTSC